MTRSRRLKLWYIVACLCGGAIVAALVLYALRQNIDLFYTPTQLLQSSTPTKLRVRLGGMVKSGSLIYSHDLQVKFVVTDFSQDLVVTYTGVLPDLFREGQGVVAMGRLLPDNTFKAEQILAKHDENYMPPELQASKK